MVSKAAKIIAFFIILGIITPLGVLAQENPWMITVFNNISDIHEKPNPDIEFNGITIISVSRYEFIPENRTKPLDFKEEFTDEAISKNQIDFKDDLNITFKEYDEIDNDTFLKPFLERHPFRRLELNPIEVEEWTVNNITLTGKIRVHATIFKNGFCLSYLVLPIVTKELKKEYNLTDNFLVANKPLKPDDVITIIRCSKGNINLKEGENTSMANISMDRRKYLKRAFFKTPKKGFAYTEYIIYSWDINKTLGKSVDLVKKNPWEISGIISDYPIRHEIPKHLTFSDISEVFTYSQNFFAIFDFVGYFEHEHMDNRTIKQINRTIKQIEEYGYNPRRIRLVEVVFLQEYMLLIYNNFVTEKLEKLREKKESEYPKEVKEIARFRREINIALDEFFFIEESLQSYPNQGFVGYGKQKRNLNFMYEILQVKMEDLSEISADMNNVVMQENNAALQASMMDIQNKMLLLTLLAITLTAVIFIGNMYSEEIKTKLRRLWEILRRLWERMAKK